MRRAAFGFRIAKRLIDIVIASTALLLVSPVMAAVSIAVRWKLGSPVLFRQTRPGLNGQPFLMLKFRTMSDARDAAGDLLPDDERLGRLGRFLRASSLDELPELWNILRGDMSLVGPRPLLMRYLERHTPEQMQRYNVRPGLTGWAQIKGRNSLTWEEKFALDCWYVQNQSIWLDLKIIALTVPSVLGSKGISAVGHSTMPEFMGTVTPQQQETRCS
ncbi:sugar transferase [Blastomonas fulva]|uniref:Bacterial sugar transferase domain-containing protein n=1 Tax=Blastomonas fulva TaxID=1550728 RepID=A0ABN5B4A8_9SPHN|nr:sugar transferase [Blastomonas fulva]ASR51053.1 hypothetical protein B5J99_05855 [Blastomonas fulva]